MIELLTIAIFNAGIIFGINKATQYEECHPEDAGLDFCDDNGIDKDSKMVGWRLRYWSLKWFGSFWSKPLFTCPPCMASVHGTWFYWIVSDVTVQSLLFWPIYILFLSGLVALINSSTKYGNS